MEGDREGGGEEGIEGWRGRKEEREGGVKGGRAEERRVADREKGREEHSPVWLLKPATMP